jgi:hypothetical protein
VKGLTLTRLEAWVLLINHVQAAFATHDAAVFIALFGGFKGAEDFHMNTYRKGGNEKRPLSSEPVRGCQ